MKAKHLMNIFGGRCFYCRREVRIGSMLPHKENPLNATVDHDIPKCRIGYTPVAQNNEVLACAECNQFKADMTGTEFISFRETKKLSQSYIEFLELRLARRLRLIHK